jgi:hypothetical protein
MAIDKSDAKVLADAIGEAVRSNQPLDPLVSQGFSPELLAQARAVPMALKWRKVKCKSEVSGATFSALVIESKTHQAGRVTQLLDYKHPKGVMTYQGAGGLVPDGMPIMRESTAVLSPEMTDLPGHALASHYKQWRWEEFWQKDLKHHAGKPLTPGMCVEPAGFQTPWNEGVVRPLGDV